MLEVNGRVIETSVRVESIIDDSTKLLGALVKELGRKAPSLVLPIAQHIVELHEELRRQYFSGRLPLKIDYLKTSFIPRSRVFINKRLYTIYNYYIYVWQEGLARPVFIKPENPREAEQYLKVLKEKMPDALMPLEQNEEITDITDVMTGQILKKLGVDPEKDYMVRVEPTPYLYVYESESAIILSPCRLREGDNMLRLEPLSSEKLKSILEYIRPLDASILAHIIKSKVKSKPQSIEDPKEYILDNSSVILYAELGLSEEELNEVIRNYQKIYCELISRYEADPLIDTIYRGIALPFYDPDSMSSEPEGESNTILPHMLLFTSTNAGKTLLYRVYVGEDAQNKVTKASLIGHMNPSTRVFEHGILHGRRKPIQIESFETREARDSISTIISYAKNGRDRSVIGGREILTVGAAAILLTGNILRDKKKRALDIQTLIKNGLLDNPEALGSRFLFFYKETEELKFKGPSRSASLEIMMRNSRILREVIESSKVQRALRAAWKHPRVREWINTPDVIEIEFTGSEDETDVYADLKQYFTVLSREGYRRLKALALNKVFLDNLDKLLTKSIDEVIDKLLEQAEDTYEFLKTEMTQSMYNVLREEIIIDPTSIILNLNKDFKRLAILVREYLKTIPKAGERESIKITLDELIVYAENEDNLKSLIPHKRLFKQRIKQYMMSAREILAHAGIHIYESQDSVFILVEPMKFYEVNAEKIKASLKQGKR